MLRPLLFLFLAASSANAQPALAIVGATVIPMDRERALVNQTIVVRNGLIETVGPAASTKTTGARIIDGRGKFVMPGLIDAHTHLLLDGDAAMYITRGVTTTIDLGSYDEDGLLAMRDSVTRGLLVGPTMLMAYFVDGPNSRRVIATPADARMAVSTARRRGFEFIKAYNSIPESTAVALLAEARRQKIAVIGHGIRSLGIERGLALGQAAVAHAEEYLYASVRDPADSAQWIAATAYTKRYGAFVIPNLSAYSVIERQWARRPVLDSMLALPAFAQMGEVWQREWSRGEYTSRKNTLDGRTAILSRFTKRLSEAGVPLMLGTDSPSIPGLFPGASAWLDMQLLKAAGLSNYEVLSAATRTPGAFIARYAPQTGRVGSIAPGYRADLLLLDEDPMRTNYGGQRPAGVMARGRWYSADDLARIERCLPRTGCS